MKLLTIISITAASISWVTGGVALYQYLKEKNSKVPTVKQVDLKRYMGTWYELYRLDNYFEKGLSSGTANYKLQDGFVEVTNRGFNINKNEWSEAKAKAYPVDSSNSKLKVYFTRFFGGNYWVAMLDSNYEWAVVSEPNCKLFWILSRTKTLEKKTIENIFTQAKSWGIKVDEVRKIDHKFSN